MRLVAMFAVAAVLASLVVGQDKEQGQKPGRVEVIRCGALVQPAGGEAQHNRLVVVEGERIRDVLDRATPPSGASAIDLSDHTCLPGLIDAHTPLLVQR